DPAGTVVVRVEIQLVVRKVELEIEVSEHVHAQLADEGFVVRARGVIRRKKKELCARELHRPDSKARQCGTLRDAGRAEVDGCTRTKAAHFKAERLRIL